MRKTDPAFHGGQEMTMDHHPYPLDFVSLRGDEPTGVDMIAAAYEALALSRAKLGEVE